MDYTSKKDLELGEIMDGLGALFCALAWEAGYQYEGTQNLRPQDETRVAFMYRYDPDAALMMLACQSNSGVEIILVEG